MPQKSTKAASCHDVYITYFRAVLYPRSVFVITNPSLSESSSYSSMKIPVNKRYIWSDYL